MLTRLSLFWFRMMADIIDNQLTDLTVADVVKETELQAQLKTRALVVKRLKPLPVEAVVRGYLIGSGWSDYRATGQVCGIDLPEGLQQAEKLTAMRGTTDNSVVYTRLIARSVSWPDMMSRSTAHRLRRTPAATRPTWPKRVRPSPQT